MKSKLLATAVGLALLGASAVTLADDGRGREWGHERGPRYSERHDFDRPHHGSYWSHQHRHHWHGHRHPHWDWHRHQHGWYGPYYRYHSYAPRHYGRHDEGVTIIFKGRID
jgi:hypothetical protein